MKPVAIAIAALLAVVPVGAPAHHGWSSYDQSKPISLTGALRAVSWTNPHGSARIKWRGKEWNVVLAPVSRMEARGLSEAMITGGKQVTITGYARLDGTREMRIERIRAGDQTIELR